MGIAFLLVAVLVGISLQVSKHVPEPYMDEIFHVPQTQHYCQGDYTYWDNKITTLPGVYVFAVIFVKILGLFSRHVDCSATTLRFVNVLFSVALVATLQSLMHKLGYHNAQLRSLAIVAIPFLFFFNFLFYTDVASTLFVFLCYHESIFHRHFLAACVGIISILVRQSNVIWVAFCGCAAVLQFLISKMQTKSSTNNNNNNNMISEMGSLISLIPRHFSSVFKIFLPYLGVMGLFLLFLIKNGSIVVGDHDNHTTAVHLCQPLYLAAILPFLLPSLLSHLTDFLNWKNFPKILLLFGVVIAVVATTTIVHPFILADNRHYTFYIFKNIIRKHWVGKYLLVPFEVFGVWAISRNLAKSLNRVWILGFYVCTCVVLASSPLVEPRYFIIPAGFVAIHHTSTSTTMLWTSVFLSAIVNALTLYIFVAKPFRWPDGSVARFMW